jgi:type II secretory ATPase GspE/PulE/Tfp pilus assembly ATPase PilB-like protein
MLDSLLSIAEIGNYISAVKLVVFLILFFPSLALVGWTYHDSKALGIGETLWTGVLSGLVFLCAILCFVIPVFWGGLSLFLVCVGTTGLIYVKQRNSKVLDFDKVLTVDHIKGLLSGKGTEGSGLDEYSFISTHNNEVPKPEPKTPDFFGYRTAYDILTRALHQRVESLRMVPNAEGYKVTAEIDGAPIEQPDLEKDQADYFVRFMKLLTDLDVKERRKPQKGTFKIRKHKDTYEWELKTAGSTVGEQIMITSKSAAQALRLGDIGMSPDQLEGMEALRKGKQGVFIISGPKRSGVTTSFYAILREHDAYINSIHTLEREVTGNLPSVTQEVYGLSDTATMSFAKKLQQILRMEPNIVGVCECNDPETAKTICQGAASGKLIYVVLQADSVVQALGKWLKLVGDRDLAVASLEGISNQRLMRQLCEECKQGYTPNQDVLKKFNLPAEKAKVLYRPGKVIYSKRGKESDCMHCQATGFRGRTGVFEMVFLNDALRKIVKGAKALPEIGTQFRRAKMLYMQEQALRKVMAGTTAINEMVRVLSQGRKASAKKTSA